MTRAQWDSAVQRLDGRLPQLRRHETVVEFIRLVALVGDAHTSLTPELEPKIGFHRFPIELYDFEDGLYILAADSAHAGLVGAKVNQIGQSSAEAAVQMAGRVISHESPNWVRARAPSLLAMPEVLAALGLGRDTLTAEFVLVQDGRQRTVRLTGAGPAAGDPHQAPALPMNLRHAMRGDDPLWLQRPDRPFWYTVLPDRTLYIGYRAVQFIHNGELNEQFFQRAFAAGDDARVERVALDIRTNGGGNNFLNRHLVREIVRRPALDQPDKLFVLIGRGVFSAAQNLVNELDYLTNATFVGEPTGNAPNQYGDARPLELPRSGFIVRVSSLYWQSHSAADDRRWFPPDVYAELSSVDYRTKQDPVLAAALRRATDPTLDERIRRAMLRSADSAVARRQIDGYRYNPENKFRNIEVDVNTAGYRLLRSDHTDAAIATFRVNVSMYPRSGNTYDSLGEALEKAGRKDEAIAAYRRALELDPRLFSSRDALTRLGATP